VREGVFDVAIEAVATLIECAVAVAEVALQLLPGSYVWLSSLSSVLSSSLSRSLGACGGSFVGVVSD